MIYSYRYPHIKKKVTVFVYENARRIIEYFIREEIGNEQAWGFAHDDEKPEVHIWIGKRCTKKKLLELIAHEISHITPKEKEEEKIAIRDAEITVFASKLTELLMNKKDVRKKRR